MFNLQFPHVCFKQAVADITESIALEEAAVSNILNSEGELIQNLKNLNCNAEELLSANKSVNNIVRTAIKMQMLLQFKLEEVEELFEGIGDVEECDDSEE